MDLQIALLLGQDGITNGFIYALLALALVLAFAVTRVIFIPQGEFVAYGALTLVALQAGMLPGTLWLLIGCGVLVALIDGVAAIRSRQLMRLPAILGWNLALPLAVWAVLSLLDPKGLPMAQQIANTEAELAKSGSAHALAVLKRLTAARVAFEDTVKFIAGHTKADPNAVFAGSVPYLMLAGNVMAGWQMARALLVAESKAAAGEDVAFMQAKIATARFYADHVLSRAPGVRDSIVEGAVGVTEMALEAF